MQRFKKILVATDTRLERHPILDGAAAVALHNKASLKIVDTVPEFPWIVRRTVQDHEQLRALMRQDKQKQLDALAQPLRKQGLAIETKVLQGTTSVEIIREVLRAEHDLVLRVAKGLDSARSGFFGNTGIRLLRQCPCAVWLVTPAAPVRFTHVLGCVDTSTGSDLDAELNDKVFELASSVSRYHGCRFSIVHAWSIFVEQFFRNRMRDHDYDRFQKGNQEQARRSLDEFLKRHDADIRAENVHILKGEAPSVIADFVNRYDVDLVVMGTVGRSGVSGLIMGNTAEQILDRIDCSVLAVKPSSFVCPIRLD